MKLFLSTEHTGLEKETTLMNVGLVSEDGRSFFGGLVDANSEMSEENMEEGYYAFSPTNQEEEVFESFYSAECFGTKEQVRQAINQWLAQFETVEWVGDCLHYDLVLLFDLIADHTLLLPSHMAPVAYDINQGIADYYGWELSEAFMSSRTLLCDYIGAKLPKDVQETIYRAHMVKEIYQFLNEEPNEY